MKLRKLQRGSDTHLDHFSRPNFEAQQLVFVLVGIKDLQ